MFTAVTYLSAGIDLVFSCVNITSISCKVIIVALSFSMSMNLICLIVFVSVSVGMGLLAGSTVTLLSIIWRTCKVVGKCNIRDTIAVNNQDTRTFHLKDSGVSVDVWTMCLFIVVFPLTSSTFLI
ncbi:BnaC09g28500D [Brassica napus]|uniref:BnaC09g28500D protein n=2 Tax=Brassica TaxID=3705 RepID=A0A078GT78_BRANA|nr:BnaC09g28500D [Brassica napus]VDD31754.1 unnamed protein product [Brassica oleracea]